MIPLPSSRSSEGSAPAFEIGIETKNRCRLHFSPFPSYLSHEEFLRIFHLFVKAVREGTPTQGQILGKRKITITAYDPVARSGGTITLARKSTWIEINPVDFLTILIDHIGPFDRPYEEVMNLLLPYVRAGNSTSENLAETCLQSLAATNGNK